jgi:poly(A) polymerase Pap1
MLGIHQNVKRAKEMRREVGGRITGFGSVRVGALWCGRNDTMRLDFAGSLILPPRRVGRRGSSPPALRSCRRRSKPG